MKNKLWVWLLAVCVLTWITLLFLSAHFYGKDSEITEDIAEVGKEVIEQELKHV